MRHYKILIYGMLSYFRIFHSIYLHSGSRRRLWYDVTTGSHVDLNHRYFEYSRTCVCRLVGRSTLGWSTKNKQRCTVDRWRFNDVRPLLFSLWGHVNILCCFRNQYWYAYLRIFLQTGTICKTYLICIFLL